jgi:hypothetical protein
MINSALNNSGFSLAPVPEMVKEFNNQNNTYDAAHGIASGTVIVGSPNRASKSSMARLESICAMAKRSMRVTFLP